MSLCSELGNFWTETIFTIRVSHVERNRTVLKKIKRGKTGRVLFTKELVSTFI